MRQGTGFSTSLEKWRLSEQSLLEFEVRDGELQ